MYNVDILYLNVSDKSIGNQQLINQFFIGHKLVFFFFISVFKPLAFIDRKVQEINLFQITLNIKSLFTQQ